jgi:hypothetical protein
MTTILNTPELKPASLGGNTSLYQSRGGKRSRRNSKRTRRNSKSRRIRRK